MARIGIIGAGVAGLGAAYRLAPHSDVTLFEANERLGGHAHTVDLTLDGHTHGIDIAFLSIHGRTYPRLMSLLDELGVEVARSSLNFSVQVHPAAGSDGMQWAGPRLNALFAERRNLWRPAFWRMLRDILRFNRIANELARQPETNDSRLSVGTFLERHGFSLEFREWYLLPILGSVWGCPTAAMLGFPVAPMVQFFESHGLLDLTSRDPWCTIRGGSARYVERLAGLLRRHDVHIRTATPVFGIRRDTAHASGSAPAGRTVHVKTAHGVESFDEVILACPARRALELLSRPSEAEAQVLGAFGRCSNRIVVHRDTSVMPGERRAWAAWNYEQAPSRALEHRAVCVHYWLNKLQPTPFVTPVFVSLNPWREPRAGLVMGEYHHDHTLFTAESVAAQARMPRLQGMQRTWFCGAWTGNGFHEDGLKSGLDVAEQLLARLPADQGHRQVALPVA